MKQLIRFLHILTVLLALLGQIPEVLAQQSNNKVLMIVSGYGQSQGQARPGYEFDEFSKAYLTFKAHGLSVDIASPKGGAVEPDKYDPTKPYNKEVLSDDAIMAKLADTLSTKTLLASDYDGVFVVGGKGAMFDLPKDRALNKLIADIYLQQGTVAAVCHGPAALVDVKLADGSYLVAGKAVNGFTNKEELLFGKKWLSQFEFMLEDKLKQRGGKFQSSGIMLSHVASDKRLITGQNPASTVAVAQEMVKSLGIKPVKMAQFQDDKTMAFIANLLSGDEKAVNLLTVDSEQYQMDLVGMYGYYYSGLANTDKALKDAVTLMKLGQKVINKPALDMRIAKTQLQLGDVAASKVTLEHILASKPDFEPAQIMLKSLSL